MKDISSITPKSYFSLVVVVSTNLSVPVLREKILDIMTDTTHKDFNNATEGIEVAKAFAERIRGKTVLVTGVNPKGIGFTTAEAFVSVLSHMCFALY